MMRKFNKKKSGNRGAILVTVVFVLAFATIFIAAAMTLTQATRKRVYTEAAKDQARLTVTSVAEAWYRAVNMCEFDDDAILNLCKNDKYIYVIANSTADRIPGLEVGTANSNPNNQTKAHFHRKKTAGATGTTDDMYTYIVDFTTTIDGHSENVRALLSYKLPDEQPGGKPFTAQFDINNPMGQSNMTSVGKLPSSSGVDDWDNIFLARQGGMNNNSGSNFYSTMVYCNGAVAFKDDVIHAKDMVILSGAWLEECANSNGNKEFTNPTISNGVGYVNLFFYGSSGGTDSIYKGNTQNFKGANFVFYLCNRSVNTGASCISDAKDVIKVNASGERTDGGATLSSTIKNKIAEYAKLESKYGKNGTDTFPTTDDFIASSKKLLGIKKDGEGTKKSFGAFLNEQCYQVKKDYVSAGTYWFTSDGSDHNTQTHEKITKKDEHGNEITLYEFANGKSEPYVMVLKGGSTYKFYFDKNVDFNLTNVVFIIDKPDKSNPILFVLMEGANIYWPGNGATSGSWSDRISANPPLGSNGIIATEGREFASAQAAYDFIKDEWNNGSSGQTATSFDKNHHTKGFGWSDYYDAKNDIASMIIGLGKNDFAIGKGMVFETFVGLFNDSYTTGVSKSHFCVYNGKSDILYGRLMTDGYDDKDGGGLVMPASPGASNLSGIDPGLHPLVTNFTLNNMIYYYYLDDAT